MVTINLLQYDSIAEHYRQVNIFFLSLAYTLKTFPDESMQEIFNAYCITDETDRNYRFKAIVYSKTSILLEIKFCKNICFIG